MKSTAVHLEAGDLFRKPNTRRWLLCDYVILLNSFNCTNPAMYGRLYIAYDTVNVYLLNPNDLLEIMDMEAYNNLTLEETTFL